jgi:hypothetical protein
MHSVIHERHSDDAKYAGTEAWELPLRSLLWTPVHVLASGPRLLSSTTWCKRTWCI